MATLPKSIFYSVVKDISEHPQITAELSKCLRLTYVEEKDNEGNVCFLDSDDVRPEFRDVFTPADVAYYICALRQRSSSVADEKFYIDFPYPQSAEEFWRFAKEGRLEVNASD